MVGDDTTGGEVIGGEGSGFESAGSTGSVMTTSFDFQVFARDTLKPEPVGAEAFVDPTPVRCLPLG